MLNPFANLRFDLPSFLIGFVSASVFFWFLSVLRPFLAQLREDFKTRRLAKISRVSSTLEDTYKNLAHRQAQHMHLTSPLFSLDEVALPVRLLAPPLIVEPGQPHANQDILSALLPYTPTWTELASEYSAPTLSLPEALSLGVNIIITGQPGSGKTFALANLLSQIVRRAPESQTLHDSIPFLIHIADLDLSPTKSEDLLTALKNSVAEEAPLLFLPRISNFVDSAFQSGRALLLLDGLDELPPEKTQQVASYLKQLFKAYPQTRFATNGLHEQLAGLLELGLFPLAIMPWDAALQIEFLNRWEALWKKHIAVEAWAQTELRFVDPLLLSAWIQVDSARLTPLEFALKTWGAYAGDVVGPRAIDAIQAHLKRLTPPKASQEALQIVALQSNLSLSPIFDSRKAREWVKSFELQLDPDPASTQETPSESDETPIPAGVPTSAENTQKSSAAQVSVPGSTLLSKMVASGLLKAHAQNSLRFSHILFNGFYSGQALSSYSVTTDITSQPLWTGKLLTLKYQAAFGDATPAVDALLKEDDPVFALPLLFTARLLPDAPAQAPWRGKIMGALAQTLQNPGQHLSLQAQVIAAFIASGDSSALALFRQLHLSPSPELRRLAALGSGALKDVKALEGLIKLSKDHSEPVRQAACLALVALGTSSALEAAAQTLVSGDENTRRAAAEAFATHPSEGHATLQDAITSEDILLRRAAIYGLARLGTEWAQDMLRTAQVEDNQWIIRDAANQALEELAGQNQHIPRLFLPPSEVPWVIEFAGRYGMGVTPGQPATDLFLLALKSDKTEEQLGALNYLRNQTNEGVISALYGALFGEDALLRERTFTTLSEMHYSGAHLPNPAQYGLG